MRRSGGWGSLESIYQSESSQIQELVGRRDFNHVGIWQESNVLGCTECLPGSWTTFCQYFDKATRDTCLDLGGRVKREKLWNDKDCKL